MKKITFRPIVNRITSGTKNMARNTQVKISSQRLVNKLGQYYRNTRRCM